MGTNCHNFRISSEFGAGCSIIFPDLYFLLLDEITFPIMKLSDVILITVVLLISNCGAKEKTSGPAPASNANRGPRAVAIDGYVVRYDTIENIINATGSLIAYEAVDIRPERAGKLVKLDFQESSFVRSGTLLAKIDDSELIAQRNRLSINLDLAEKEVARGKELLAIQGISQEEIDRLVNRVEEIKAEQTILDVQIEKSRITAPFSGILGLRQMSRGAYATPSDVIVELRQISPIKLEFDVPERYLVKVKKGQELEFTIVGSERLFKARVYAIDTQISPTTRTFKVRATSENRDNLLKPGQFAKVTLVTGVDNRAMLVPTDAVIPILDGKQVYVLNKGRAIARPVQTGNREASRVQITEGLQTGDTVVVSGLLSLSDGTAVSLSNLVEPQNAEE